MTRLVSLLIFFFCLTPAAPAQEKIIQVNAQLSERTVSQEDVVILGIVISGNTTIRQAEVRLPSLPDFRLVNQSTRTNTQIINGQVTSALQYLYYLVPRKSGTLTIPAVDVVFEEETYTTDPLSLEVTQAQSNTEIIPRYSATKSTVFVGEQLQFEIELLLSTKIRVSRYDLAERPSIEGFINLPDPTLTRQERAVVDLNKERYLKLTLGRNILFPLSAGSKRIQGVPFEIQYYNDRFGNNIKFAERTTNDLVITVLPLPDNAPESFNGAVGNFQIDWYLDRTEGKAEEPFTLIITVSGNGDVERIPQPVLDFGDHIEVIAVKNNANTALNQGVWGGNRRWEFILVPSAAGEEVLGPLTYTYFDPDKEAYETVQTEPITLTLDEAEKSAETFVPQQFRPEAREADIRFIHKNRVPAPGSALPSTSIILLLISIPIAINILAFLITTFMSTSGQNKKGNLKRTAFRKAMTRLSALPNARREAKQQELDTIAAVIKEYFECKMDLNRSAGVNEIRSALKRYDLHESAELNTLVTIINHCAAGKYAPDSLNRASISDLLEKTRGSLKSLEEKL